MKKFVAFSLAVLLVAAALLGLVSCGKEETVITVQGWGPLCENEKDPTTIILNINPYNLKHGRDYPVKFKLKEKGQSYDAVISVSSSKEIHLGLWYSYIVDGKERTVCYAYDKKTDVWKN